MIAVDNICSHGEITWRIVADGTVTNDGFFTDRRADPLSHHNRTYGFSPEVFRKSVAANGKKGRRAKSNSTWPIRDCIVDGRIEISAPAPISACDTLISHACANPAVSTRSGDIVSAPVIADPGEFHP